MLRLDTEQSFAQVNATSVVFARALQAAERTIRDAGEGAARQEGVRASVRVLCVIARQEDMAPERFLVGLKEILTDWRALDSIPRDKQDDVRRDLVRYAINAYYDDARAC